MSAAVHEDEAISRHTSFRIGGGADAWVDVADRAALLRVIEFCHDAAIPWRVLGRGSNVLVSAQGLRGVVISLGGELALVRTTSGRVTAGAGAPLDSVVESAEHAGLTGSEFLAGIPGTVGGALMTNAGAFGSSLSDIIEGVRGYDAKGCGWETTSDQLRPRYREPLIDRGLLVTEVIFRLNKGSPSASADEIRRQRWAKHPKEPSAGSFFKNPIVNGERTPAGRLIDECSLKGTGIGQARVSERHANFIVNVGGARFVDVYELAQLVKARVEERTGVMLEEEVRILPEPAREAR
jgi:UDP-N-acetylmuramate dehydrogenase